MEEKEQLSLYKINIAPNIKNKKKYRLKDKKKYIIISISIIIIIFFFVLLIIQNIKLRNKLKNNSYFSERTISVNFFKQNFTTKFLFDGRDDDSNIKDKNIIHVSYSLDDQEVYPTFISMLSGLENCNKDNFIVYHLLLSHDFNMSYTEIFESLKKKYPVKINYYIIPNIFGSSAKWTAGTDCVYYKILIPLMFPDYNRMIYLDGDTLIRHDILEMYQYPFNDSYILGFPFYMGYVMGDLLSLTLKNNSIWHFREQDSINYAFYPKVGFLPLKYGIYMIGTKEYFKALSKYTYSPLNLTEGYEAVEDPSIVHFSCCWPKVWTNGTKNLFKNKDICIRYQKEFYFYAKKSKYYKIINDTLFFKKKK